MDWDRLKNVIDSALKLGAQHAEIVMIRSVDLEIEVARGEIETLAQAESIGAGLRVFTPDRRMGFAYTTALNGQCDDLVAAAWHNALANAPDPHNVLPSETSFLESNWTAEDPASVAVADKVAFCRELEQKVLAADPRMTHVQQAGYSDGRTEFTIANSRGLFRSHRDAHCVCSVSAAAAEPGVDSELGWEFDFARRFGALQPDWVAGRCAEQATRMLGGKPCATGAMPLVLDRNVAADFISVLAPAFMAHNVLKGKSLYMNRVGEPIASACVSVIDQNDLRAGPNRAPFDAEGAMGRRTGIVEAGTLRRYLHNAYTAHRMDQPGTSNAGRGGGFRSAPEVGPSSLFLEPGKHAPDELMAMAGSGLFITDAMGVHMADPISGDFSFGVTGLTIENGRLGRPVRGVTVAGNIKDLLMHVEAVGDDLRFFGAYGAPTILVSELMVSGD